MKKSTGTGGKFAGIFSRKKRSVSKDISEHQKQTYYIKNLEYSLKLGSTSDYSKKVKQHFLETFAALRIVQKVRKPANDVLVKSQIQCAQLNNEVSKSKVQ